MKISKILALSLCSCLLVSGVCFAEPTAEDWENPAVVGRGKEPPHATLMPFPDRASAMRGDRAPEVPLVALLGSGGLRDEAVDVHGMRVRGDLSAAELRAYVRRDAPLDCAGSYKIESLGIALFEAIEGRDFTSIVGLPMVTVVSMLRRAGVSILG